jgi:hypothetical protein
MQLPPKPALKGQGQPYLVFGYVLPVEALLAWADARQLSPNEHLLDRLDEAFDTIEAELMVARKRIRSGLAQIPAENGPGSVPVNCLVIGSNASQSRLDDAYDMEAIRLCMKVLGTEEFPQWRRSSRAN